jgi:hypothetical protein
LWEYLLNNHLSTNNDSLGTEGIDSESGKANANLAQYGAGFNNKDGGTVQNQVQIPNWMQWKVVL